MPLECDSGDAAGSPVKLSTGYQAGAIAVDDTSVYWSQSGASCQPGCYGSVSKISKCGGAPVVLAAQENLPTGLVSDGKNVYWADLAVDNGAGGTVNGSVRFVSVDGGTPDTLAPGVAPNKIAMDDTNIYWAENGGGLFRSTKLSGSTTQLATGPVAVIATDGAKVYWTTAAGGYTVGSVKEIARDGGTVITLASSDTQPTGIAVDGVNVYWANRSGGTIMSVPIAGGTPVPLATGLSNPGSVATDGLNVYWTSGDGKISRVPVAGGTVVTLASGQNAPVQVVLDETSAYWVNAGTTDNGNVGAIMKLTPR
jgi:hypothetical protein